MNPTAPALSTTSFVRRGRPPSRRPRCGTRHPGGQLTRGLVQEHARHLRVADHLEVGALLDVALEERVVRARALAVARRGLQQRHDAGVALAVAAVVVTDRDAGGDRGVDELLRAAQDRRTHRDAERTLGVVRVGVDDDVAARRQAFALLEVGQHLVVGSNPSRPPSAHASKSPGMAADVRHVVDARRAAEHLAARHHHPAVARGRARPRRRRPCTSSRSRG